MDLLLNGPPYFQTLPAAAQHSDDALFDTASTMSSHHGSDRDRLVYDLIMRQEPKQARMCGVGGKADRRPIDPPPIVQLRVIDPSQGERRRRGSTNGSPPGSPTPSSSSRQQDDSDNSYAQSFLQNPYYFMFASLAKPDDDTELHWLKDGRTRCTTGSVVSSLYHLKDPQNNNEDAGFFVFPDLSVRTEGSYRLKLSLFEVVGNNVRHCKSIFSAPFYVYTAKKFPGMEESTPLSCSLADQGIKIRIRKDIRVRKRPNQGADFSVPLSMDDDEEDDHERSTRQLKRSRTDDGMGPGSSAMGAVPQTPQSQQPWPPVTIADPALGPPIPPPPGAATSTTLTTGADGPQQGTMTLGAPMAMGAYDSRGVYVYDQQQPQQPQPVPQQPPQQYRDPNQPQPQQAAAPPPPPQQHQPQQPYGAPQPPPHPHMPPQHAMGPPPGMPHHAAPPPPPPQGYHYPQPAWGAPPQPQPVYDGGYYQQHAPPVQHPHYPPHPNAYAQPPPPPPPGRYEYPAAMYQQQPMAPMPAQYGYYEQPPVHHQQMHPPPPPQQAPGPPPQQQQQQQQYGVPPAHQQQQAPPPPQYNAPVPAPVPAAPTQQTQGTNSPTTIPPPVAQPQQQPQQQQQQQQPPPATPSYDYSYRPATGSPQPRQYAPHPQHPQQPPPPPAAYGGYAPPPPPHTHTHMQRAYAPVPPPPPPGPYGYAYAPPATPGVPADWTGFGQQQQPGWGSDPYGQQQQQQMGPPPPQPIPQGVPLQPQQPQQGQGLQQVQGQQGQGQQGQGQGQQQVPTVQPPPVPASGSSSSSLMGATGDRIQLAPLRSSGSPTQAQGQVPQPQPSQPTQQNGYYNGGGGAHGRSGSREEYGRGEGREGRERSGSRGVPGGVRELSAGREDARKKNPLAIGSIISGDGER